MRRRAGTPWAMRERSLPWPLLVAALVAALGWALVASTYHGEVHVLANVVDLTPRPEKNGRRVVS